jgi:hypothetical protein
MSGEAFRNGYAQLDAEISRNRSSPTRIQTFV